MFNGFLFRFLIKASVQADSFERLSFGEFFVYQRMQKIWENLP